MTVPKRDYLRLPGESQPASDIREVVDAIVEHLSKCLPKDSKDFTGTMAVNRELGKLGYTLSEIPVLSGFLKYLRLLIKLERTGVKYRWYVSPIRVKAVFTADQLETLWEGFVDHQKQREELQNLRSTVTKLRKKLPDASQQPPQPATAASGLDEGNDVSDLAVSEVDQLELVGTLMDITQERDDLQAKLSAQSQRVTTLEGQITALRKQLTERPLLTRADIDEMLQRARGKRQAQE